ncbi:MAG TPA: ParA family protein [Acidobacteriota bacterium]|nr:ParA family protein [Acidobacteriota bacterium]
MKTIAIANQKGGTGKTTTCVNLAACLARLGLRVLAIDIDSQANLTSHFGLTPFDLDLTIYEVLTNPNIVFTKQAQVIKNVRPNLDLIPANLNLSSLDIELAGAVNRDQRLRRKLKDIADSYDYILIDCPPALNFATLNAFTACNILLVCVQTHLFSFTAVEKLLQTVNEVSEQYEIPIAAYALPTMFEKSSNSHNVVLEKIRDHFGPYSFSPIHKNVRCIDASISCQPVIELDRSCSASVDYQRLAKEIVNEFEEKSNRRNAHEELG